jgi:hypothetical protein
LALMLVGPSTASTLGAASPSPSVDARTCEGEAADLLARLPDTANEVLAVRPTDAWPSFDATTASMLPDASLDEALSHTYLSGEDATRVWDPFDESLDDEATILGVPVSAMHGGNAGQTTESLIVGGPDSLNFLSARVEGISGADLLPELVARRLAALTDIACEVGVVDAIPVLLTSSAEGRAAFLGYRDAWLVADSISRYGSGLGEAPLDGPLFDQALGEAVAHVAGLPDDPLEGPFAAPEVGTRITPPAASTELAAILDEVTPRGDLFGDFPGMLGRGMLQSTFLTSFAPQVSTVAAELGLDPRTLWGDGAFGFNIDDPDAAITFVAVIDPTGDGGRWIGPLASSYVGPSIPTNGQDLFGDPLPTLPPPGVQEMTLGGKRVMGVLHDQYGDESVVAFYASGPFVFLIGTGLESSAAEILEALP